MVDSESMRMEFKRGQDPKKSMSLGMTAEQKIKAFIELMKSFGFKLQYEWQKEESKFEILEKTGTHSSTVYADFLSDEGVFDIWNFGVTSDINEAVRETLKNVFYPKTIDQYIKEKEAEIERAKKIKSFINETSKGKSGH